MTTVELCMGDLHDRPARVWCTKQQLHTVQLSEDTMAMPVVKLEPIKHNSRYIVIIGSCLYSTLTRKYCKEISMRWWNSTFLRPINVGVFSFLILHGWIAIKTRLWSLLWFLACAWRIRRVSLKAYDVTANSHHSDAVIRRSVYAKFKHHITWYMQQK